MINVSGVLSCFNNPKANALLPYTPAMKQIISVEHAKGAVEDFSNWPDYTATPLYDLSGLAQTCGIDKLWYKDESKRFELKSFKALGGAYALAKQLQKYVENQTGEIPGIADLFSKKHNDIIKGVVVTCATDGNHGRSVAWGAMQFGCQCVIYIHEDVSVGRQTAMEAYGAEVIRVAGNYDASVRQADKDAKEFERIIISDNSYPGYMEIPKNVLQGYTVMTEEIVSQLEGDIPTHVFIQAGCGGLACAVGGYFWDLWAEKRPRLIIVEPEKANCLQESAMRGSPYVVEGDLETVMAGLSCGEVSQLAWDILETGSDDFITLSESAVADTMKLLDQGVGDDPEVEAGESAVAGLGALIIACDNNNQNDDRNKLGLDQNSKVLILGTEGATDPEVYKRLMEQQ
ncbi:MAG: diaminopropionate ammonia-lyase [Arenicella sp.]